MPHYTIIKVESSAIPAIKQALELYARIGCGQWEAIANYLALETVPPPNTLEKLSEAITEAKSCVLGLSPHASFSIASDKVKLKYKIAYDIWMHLDNLTAGTEQPSIQTSHISISISTSVE